MKRHREDEHFREKALNIIFPFNIVKVDFHYSLKLRLNINFDIGRISMPTLRFSLINLIAD